MAFEVPNISLGVNRPREDIVKDIRNACLVHGFFQVVDHPVPLQLIEKTFYLSREFFKLPLEEKQRVLKTDHMVGGYEPFKSYNLGPDPDKQTDYGLNEGFAIAPAWGENRFIDDQTLAGFGRTCREYFDSVQELGRTLLSLIAEGLDVESDFFDPFLNHQLSFARLTHYYRQPGGSGDDVIGAAAHTDWGALTLLVQDQIGGLQIYNRVEDHWIDVVPNSSAFVCNIGDLLSRWTNDTYTSTLHRVLAPPHGVDRYSIPFFNPGNPDHSVEVIPGCVPPGEAPRYKPIKAGEYIKMKHYKHNNVAPTP